MKPGTTQKEFLYGDLTYKIRRILFEVHNELGMYCREKQYGDAVEEKFKQNAVSYKREIKVGDSGNTIDFTVEDKLVLEFKAKPFLSKEDYAQTQRYLQALNFRLGLLVNFRTKYLDPRRVLNIKNL